MCLAVTPVICFTHMNRRQFAAIASAAALQAADPVEVGVIGIGGRGTLLLNAAIKSGLARVTHLADINPSALDKALTTAAAFQPKGHREYRQLLDVKSIEAVYIASPCHLHKEMILAALAAGKHVYCEKPMALTPEDNRAILEASKKSKGILQIGFQRRYSQPMRELVRRLQSGEVGKPLFGRGQYWAPRDLPRHQAWKFDRDRFGDMIVEQAVHQFDLYSWIYGNPLRACGFGGANLYVNEPPGRTIMDHYSITYEYPGGIHVSFTHLYYAVMGMGSGNGDEFFTSTGGVKIDSRAIAYFKRDARDPFESVPMATESQSSSEASVRDFLECVRTGRKPVSNAENGRTSTLSVIMGLRSMVQGRVVEWKEVDV